MQSLLVDAKWMILTMMIETMIRTESGIFETECVRKVLYVSIQFGICETKIVQIDIQISILQLWFRASTRI